MFDDIMILHIPWQLSCSGMCAGVTWFDFSRKIHKDFWQDLDWDVIYGSLVGFQWSLYDYGELRFPTTLFGGMGDNISFCCM